MSESLIYNVWHWIEKGGERWYRITGGHLYHVHPSWDRRPPLLPGLQCQCHGYYEFLRVYNRIFMTDRRTWHKGFLYKLRVLRRWCSLKRLTVDWERTALWAARGDPEYIQGQLRAMRADHNRGYSNHQRSPDYTGTAFFGLLCVEKWLRQAICYIAGHSDLGMPYHWTENDLEGWARNCRYCGAMCEIGEDEYYKEMGWDD